MNLIHGAHYSLRITVRGSTRTARRAGKRPPRSDIIRHSPTAAVKVMAAAFHILMAVADEDRHGYAIIQDVAERPRILIGQWVYAELKWGSVGEAQIFQ